MKLSKKLLPFVTFASVTTMSLTSFTSCNSGNNNKPDKPQKFVYVINGSDTEPEAWESQYSPQVTGDEPTSDYTREYFAAAKKDKNILAGDIASSYYSSVFPGNSTLTKNLKEVRITIKNVDAEQCTASFIIEDIPTDACLTPEEYHVKTEINNMPYIAAHIYIYSGGVKKWDGWAVEPSAWVVYGNVKGYLEDTLHISETNAILGARYAEYNFLELYAGWSAKYTTYNASGQEAGTISWDFLSKQGTWDDTDETSLYYFMQHFIHSWDLSFRSHYLETWNPKPNNHY